MEKQIRVLLYGKDSTRLATSHALLSGNVNGFNMVCQLVGLPDESLRAGKAGFDCVVLQFSHTDEPERFLHHVKTMRAGDRELSIVVLSGWQSVEFAAACLDAGACDCISEGDVGAGMAQRVVGLVTARRKKLGYQGQMAATVGGRTMRNAEHLVEEILDSDVPSVLVLGESGVGKELVADLIRERISPELPFVAVNCASLSGELADAELFGYKKGAFTGALVDHEGLFGKADRGWIFLDEVARLPDRTQASLLRAIESGEIRPVGGTSSRAVRVRVLAATNEDLHGGARYGGFRQDLLQRLTGYELPLPPWRKREMPERSEILDCLMHRLNRDRAARGKGPLMLDALARRVLLEHSWSEGNIRQLRQTLLRSAVHAVGDTIALTSLPAPLRSSAGGLPLLEEPGAERTRHALAVPFRQGDSFDDLELELFHAFLMRTFAEQPDSASSFRAMGRLMGMDHKRLKDWLVKLDAVHSLPEALHLLARKSREV